MARRKSLEEVKKEREEGIKQVEWKGKKRKKKRNGE